MSSHGKKGRTGLGHLSTAKSSSDGDDSEGGSFQLWSFLRDKKRLAWALLSVLKNNVVSAPLYYVLLCIEYLQLLFLYIVFAIIYYANAGKIIPAGDYSF